MNDGVWGRKGMLNNGAPLYLTDFYRPSSVIHGVSPLVEPLGCGRRDMGGDERGWGETGFHCPIRFCGRFWPAAQNFLPKIRSDFGAGYGSLLPRVDPKTSFTR